MYLRLHVVAQRAGTLDPSDAPPAVEEAVEVATAI
jgi:hypothetical protein